MIKQLLEEIKSISNEISGFARYVPDWAPAGMEEKEAGPWAECLWGVWGVESSSSRLRATCLQHLRLCTGGEPPTTFLTYFSVCSRMPAFLGVWEK